MREREKKMDFILRILKYFVCVCVCGWDQCYKEERKEKRDVIGKEEGGVVAHTHVCGVLINQTKNIQNYSNGSPMFSGEAIKSLIFIPSLFH